MDKGNHFVTLYLAKKNFEAYFCEVNRHTMEKNNSFLNKMEELVRQIIAYNNISCYRIDSITETHRDVNGEFVQVPVVRVVGFFEDTISKVANVLNNEFDLAVVKENSDDNASFSSIAKTYFASLKPPRIDLPEYKSIGSKKIEVRVSSILQDVYSAMNTRLSNGKNTLPNGVKRDLYRVGAFLEMADIEFLKIRNLVHDATGTNDPIPTNDGIREVTRDTQAAAIPAASSNGVHPEAVSQQSNKTTPVAEQVKEVAEQAEKKNVEAIDMTVDSFNSLAVSIDNIENRNGVSDNSYLDLLNSKTSVVEEGYLAQGNSTNEESVAVNGTPVPENAAKVEEAKPVNGNAPDPVNLNIDNVETFNMNVSGMIEKTTEIIREGNTAEEKPEPFYNEVKPEKKPVVMDENAQMNEAMLKEYVLNSKLVKEVDKAIADRAGAKVNEELDIEGDVERLRFLKVFTLRQLHERLTDNKEDIVAFAEKWIGKDNGGSFDTGICLFYLEYLLVGKKNDPAFAVEYVLKFISDNDYSARYIIPTYNSIRQTTEPSNFAHLTLK